VWNIQVTEAYKAWHFSLNISKRARVVATIALLQKEGPNLGRPYADTIKESRFSQMKELRVQSMGDPVRIFFAFSPDRSAILLCAGSKAGNEKRFYTEMIARADDEFTEYLNHFYQSR